MFTRLLLTALSFTFVLSAPLAADSTGAVLLNATDSSVDNSTSTSNSTADHIAASWYAGYHASDFPVQNVSWSKYTHVIYAFAPTAGDGSMVSLAESDAAILPDFVELAHQNVSGAYRSLPGTR